MSRMRKAVPGTRRYAVLLLERGLQADARRGGRLSGIGGALGILLSQPSDPAQVTAAEAACASVGYPCTCNWEVQTGPGPWPDGTVFANILMCRNNLTSVGYDGQGIIKNPYTYKSDVEYQIAPPPPPPPPPTYTAPVATTPTSTSPSYSPAPAVTAPTYTPAVASYTPPASTPAVTASAASSHAQTPATIPAAAQSVIYQAAGTQTVGGGFELSRTPATSSAGSSSGTAATAAAAAAATSTSTLDELWKQAAEHKTALAIAAIAAAAYFFGSSNKRGR